MKESAVERGEKGKKELISPPVRLVICICGIYFFYLYYGILQEQLYRTNPMDQSKFESTFFLLFVQCLVNFVVAFFMREFLGGEENSKPLGR